MAEPKFHVGQLVSVLCFSVIKGKPPLHVPRTTINNLVYLRENDAFPNTLRHIASSDGWYYSVTRAPGVNTWVHEVGVHPFQGDTEYLPTSTETPISQEMEQ